jgi:hypothetical protein
MHATLPRELRDTIYGAVLGPYHYERVTKWSVANTGTLRTKDLAFVNSLLHKMTKTNADTIHWWLRSYMGKKAAVEIVECWYHIRTFQFTSKNLNRLPIFLATDAFDKGLEPGLMVQRMRLHIHATPSRYGLSSQEFEAVKRHLSTIKNKHVDLSIRIDTASGKPTSKRARMRNRKLNNQPMDLGLQLALEDVASTVYQLRKDKFDRVTVKGGQPLTDYTFLFDVAESKFLENMVRHLSPHM